MFRTVVEQDREEITSDSNFSDLMVTDQETINEIKEKMDRQQYVVTDDEKADLRGALDRAIVAKQWKTVRFLISLGVDIRAKGTIRSRVLLHAARSGQIKVVREVINAGVNINLTDAAGYNALDYAFYAKQWYIIELLLKHGATIEAKDNTWNDRRHVTFSNLLIRAAMQAKWDIVGLLVKSQESLKWNNVKSVIHLLYKESQGDTLRAMLAKVDLVERDLSDPVGGNLLLTKGDIKQAINNNHFDVILLMEAKLQQKKEEKGASDAFKEKIVACTQSLWDLSLPALVEERNAILEMSDDNKAVKDSQLMKNFNDIKKCLNNGASISRDLLTSFARHGRLETLKEIVVTGFKNKAVNPQSIPISANIPLEQRAYLAKLRVIAELKWECQKYKTYLQKTLNSPTEDPNKKTQAERKVAAINRLMTTLNFSDVDMSLENFKRAFNNDPEVKDNLNTFPDQKGRKFLRTLRAIFTAGFYVSWRHERIDSRQFWKSRREVFIDRINEQVSDLTPRVKKGK